MNIVFRTSGHRFELSPGTLGFLGPHVRVRCPAAHVRWHRCEACEARLHLGGGCDPGLGRCVLRSALHISSRLGVYSVSVIRDPRCQGAEPPSLAGAGRSAPAPECGARRETGGRSRLVPLPSAASDDRPESAREPLRSPPAAGRAVRGSKACLRSAGNSDVIRCRGAPLRSMCFGLCFCFCARLIGLDAVQVCYRALSAMFWPAADSLPARQLPRQ